jgi:aminocarboxymuconate-semialdehyde decarboxylase
VHTHILPEYIPDWEKEFGYSNSGFIKLEDIKDSDTMDKNMMQGNKFFRRIQCNCFNVEARINDINKQNIKMQVLSVVPVLFNYNIPAEDCLITSQYYNNHIESICNKNPSKFIGLGTLPMQDVSLACKELERCILELKLKGVEIGTHINEINLDDEIYYPFWKLVEELGAVVFIHPWDMMGNNRHKKYWGSWLVGMPAETCTAITCMIFGGIYKKFPKIKVYYAHGGGNFIGTKGRIQKGYDCRPDLFPEQCDIRDYMKYIIVDSLTHDSDMLLKLIKELGSSNIMCGSDYPFPLGEYGMIDKMYINSLISLETFKNISYLNACKFFGVNMDIDPNIKTIVLIPEIIENPIKYSYDMSVELLSIILNQFCIAYYNNMSYVDNITYDTMVDILKKRDNKNPFLLNKIY